MLVVTNCEHVEICNRIEALCDASKTLSGSAAHREHLRLLHDNANDGELIVFASRPCLLVHAVVVGRDAVQKTGIKLLNGWSDGLNSSRAEYGYVRGSGFTIDQEYDPWCRVQLNDTKRLVFQRYLEVSNDEPHYYEILQEYAHSAKIHWRRGRQAYSRFDELGDWEDVVTVTVNHNNDSYSDLVTFQRKQLDIFLQATRSVLVRMFDIGAHPKGSQPEAEIMEVVDERAGIAYHHVVNAGVCRGVQIIQPPPLPNDGRSYTDYLRIMDENDKKYVKFAAWDMRHGCVADISTDPAATTNHMYPENDLPYAISPAFFRAEVLSKYKSDPDKYTVEDRQISCRGGWFLKSYDVNEAEQVHAYICDLRELPYKEQQYWKNFNEGPKTGISERSYTQDFKAEYSYPDTASERLRLIMRGWMKKRVKWWKLRESGMENVTWRPNNRKDWTTAFSDLAKFVIEGFDDDVFRSVLKGQGSDNKCGAGITLIEKVLIHRGLLGNGCKLDGLRKTQRIRSKCFAHSRGSECRALVDEAEGYGSFNEHFESICEKVVEDLRRIERIFS